MKLEWEEDHLVLYYGNNNKSDFICFHCDIWIPFKMFWVCKRWNGG